MYFEVDGNTKSFTLGLLKLTGFLNVLCLNNDFFSIFYQKPEILNSYYFLITFYSILELAAILALSTKR